MQDLIFTPPQIYCPECGGRIMTSIEELGDNDEIICPHCNHEFVPNIKVEKFLNLIKEIEKQNKL